MLLLLCAPAQTLSLLDAQTQVPLQGARVHNPLGQEVYSDSLGQANIDGFDRSYPVVISLDGYHTRILHFPDMEAINFVLSLSALEWQLEEVVVSAYADHNPAQSSINMQALPLQQMERAANLNLSDALSTINGVQKFSSGPGIAKPVVRGLYGNRILVLFSGLRFNNQQWQDEHGLGLSSIGIAGVELIKGPLSVLYGSGAQAGVITILEESPAPLGTSETDLKIGSFTNTGGYQIEAGYKVRTKKYWYRLRAGSIQHADYSDGNGQRVLNSRFNTHQFKASLGFKRGNWWSNNHYQFSSSRFGFLFDELEKYMKRDARWSRNMQGPHHTVMLHLLSSENRIDLPKSRLKVNFGLQSNYRAEDEGGGALSLQMHLLNVQYHAKWQKNLGQNWIWVIAHNSSYERNSNFGLRKIVPDANLFESSLSSYLKKEAAPFIWEFGLGGGWRHIQTLLTPGQNSAEKDLAPFSTDLNFGNGLFGLSYQAHPQLRFKFNLASGSRSPNLAELGANGLHEGIYIYELGNPNLQNEQNVNTEIGLDVNLENWQFNAALYRNWFRNYIFLQATNSEWFGFPVYHFVQNPALLKGYEISLNYRLPFWEIAQIGIEAAQVIGQLEDGNYLPFMPAATLKPSLRIEQKAQARIKWHAYLNTEFVAAQNRTASDESPSEAYQLVNAGFGLSWQAMHANYQLNISAQNLLDQAYASHLSRIRTFGILNMGRSVNLSLKINFKHKIKSQKNA